MRTRPDPQANEFERKRPAPTVSPEKQQAVDDALEYVNSLCAGINTEATEISNSTEVIQTNIEKIAEEYCVHAVEVIRSLRDLMDMEQITVLGEELDKIEAQMAEEQLNDPDKNLEEIMGGVSQTEKPQSSEIEHTEILTAEIHPDRIAQHVEIQDELNLEERVKMANEALDAKHINDAIEIVSELVADFSGLTKESLEEDDIKLLDAAKKRLAEALQAENREEKSKIYKFTCSALDFVPYLGSAKMTIEGAVGKTLGGEQLKGKERILHTAEGLVFLTVEIGTLGGGGLLAKGGVKGSKVMTRGAAILRKGSMTLTAKAGEKAAAKVAANGLRLGSRELYHVGSMVAKNPQLEKMVTKQIVDIAKARKNRKSALAITGLKEVMTDSNDKGPETQVN